MPGLMNNLYKIQKKDITKAAAVLADAFQPDPVWKKVFDNITFKQTSIFFEGAVKYCLKFGEVYASSENIEGVAAWTPDHFADMTFWRTIQSGSFFSMLKMGIKMTGRLMKIKPAFAPLEEARREYMKGKKYIYFMVIGVSSQYQGQGHGGKILRAVIEKSKKLGIPIYLETATKKNIHMYEKKGFKIITKIEQPIINVPQWSMILEPNE